MDIEDILDNIMIFVCFGLPVLLVSVLIIESIVRESTYDKKMAEIREQYAKGEIDFLKKCNLEDELKHKYRDVVKNREIKDSIPSGSERVVCPHCRNEYYMVPFGERKGGVSGGKAVAGAIVAGPVGAVLGGASGKRLKSYKCPGCGYTFEK